MKKKHFSGHVTVIERTILKGVSGEYEGKLTKAKLIAMVNGKGLFDIMDTETLEYVKVEEFEEDEDGCQCEECTAEESEFSYCMGPKMGRKNKRILTDRSNT